MATTSAKPAVVITGNDEPVERDEESNVDHESLDPSGESGTSESVGQRKRQVLGERQVTFTLSRPGDLENVAVVDVSDDSAIRESIILAHPSRGNGRKEERSENDDARFIDMMEAYRRQDEIEQHGLYGAAHLLAAALERNDAKSCKSPIAAMGFVNGTYLVLNSTFLMLHDRRIIRRRYQVWELVFTKITMPIWLVYVLFAVFNHTCMSDAPATAVFVAIDLVVFAAFLVLWTLYWLCVFAGPKS